MGWKEQEKKAKRAAELAAGAPPCKAATPEPCARKEMEVDGPALAGSGSRPSSVSSESGVVEAENQYTCAKGGWPVHLRGSQPGKAGSGKPVQSWKRKPPPAAEGVGGQYTCAKCGARLLRSGFLIEATDLEGKLCVEKDWEGKLYGRCYLCCRGRGPHGGDDIYKEEVEKNTDEEDVEKCFRKVLRRLECNRRHLKRSDVKNNDHSLLKIERFKELLDAVARGHRPELSKSRCRRRVFDFLRGLY